MKKYFFLTALLIWIISVQMVFSQIITSDPPFPTENDSIVIYFDATQGNQGLLNYNIDDVYAYTGVTVLRNGQVVKWQHIVNSSWSDDPPKAKCTLIAPNLYKLVIGYPRVYYGVPANEKILGLDLLFKNKNESKVGRDVNDADIYYALYEPGITVKVVSPSVAIPFGDPYRSPIFLYDSINVILTAAPIGTQIQSLHFLVDQVPVAETTEDTLFYTLYKTELSEGLHSARFIATDTSGLADTLDFVIDRVKELVDEDVPPGIEPGITYLDNSSATLCLFAPGKKFVYLIGDFNDWKVDHSYLMHRDSVGPDSILFWYTLTNLTPGEEIGFQYLVDGDIRIGDPYSELVLDGYHDQFITSQTFPNLKPYPSGKTEEYVSVLQPGKTPFQWAAINYQRPPKEKLIIYELLVRDFSANHNFQTVIDSLDYLQRLGINAIELMPVMEFDGNSSWGYNPAFHLAVDKYYGRPEDLKRLIDEAHKRGIAVILDIVLNHAFGQNPLVRLYNEGKYGKPTADNPWFNPEDIHPFSVGYDFNHESIHTQYYVDRVTSYWLTEFKVDGFRFDLSKGFTQRYSGDNVSYWGQYDAGRIAILKRMADKIWEIDSTAYVILEHFADNTEETVLANYGMLLWNNMNYNYAEASMGYIQNSDFSWGYFRTRGWNVPNHVVYMESHDEEWINYKNQHYGRYTTGYNIRELGTALNRIKLIAAFFFTVPGPRMIWQFEELGYDETLEFSPNGRTGEKPIHWEYYQDPLRKKLYETFRWLIKLRNENDVFTSTQTQVSMEVGKNQYARRMNLSHPSMNVTIIGNFDIVDRQVVPNFQSTGIWYDFFNNDSIVVTDTQAPVTLNPGEFRIFTSKKLESPAEDIILDLDEPIALPREFELEQNYPNPFNPVTVIPFRLPVASEVEMVIYNLNGQKIKELIRQRLNAGYYEAIWDGTDDDGVKVSSGIYFYRLKAGKFESVKKMVLIK